MVLTYVGFEALTAVSTKVVTQTGINLYQSTRRYSPEGSHLDTRTCSSSTSRKFASASFAYFGLNFNRL
jgi:hypothetical protein